MIDLPQLCIGIRSGDQQASETLVKLLRARLVNSLTARLGDDAQDVFQEVCTAVVTAIQENRIEHPQFVLAYAHSVSERIKIRFLERRARAMGKLLSMDDSEHPIRIPVPATQEDELVKKDMFRILLRARAVLPQIDQQIIQRVCFEEQDPLTVAADLGLTVETLRVRKSRAIQFLKAEFERITQRRELMAA